MATISVQLQKGITVGEKVFKEAMLREPTAMDVIEATEASERIVMVPQGMDDDGRPVMEPQLVASPTMVGVNVLRRQIVSIGDFKAPIDDLLFQKLSPTDLNILQREALKLEKASLEVAQRGRDHDQSKADTPVD